MSTFLYGRPSESLLASATSVVVNTGAQDTAYPASNLYDNRPEKPAKLTGTTGSWVAAFGGAQRVDLVALIQHNLSAGLDVRIQGNATNSWGAPTLSQAFTIPARLADNFTVNVWLDLSTLVPVLASRTLQYWRLLINAANAAPVSIGEWVMYSTKRDFGVRNIKRGSERYLHRPAVVQRTDGKVKQVYSLGTTYRSVTVDLEPTDATLAEVDALFRASQGQFKPFLVVPHSSESDAWFVTFASDDWAWKREWQNYNPCTIEFEELARGLYP